MNRNCTLHNKQPLTHFCEFCRDAVCNTCIQQGPHADPRHRISSISEAAIIRQRFYLAFRDKQVNSARQQVNQLLQSLSRKQEQLLQERRVIQKDINLQFEGVASRVQSLVARRIVKKQTQIKKYQQILNHMEDLVYSFDAVVQLPQRFLLCYKQFNHQLKLLETMTLDIHLPDKNKQTQLSLTTSDLKNISVTWRQPSKETDQLNLPRQMAVSFAKANQLPLYQAKNQLLNQLITKAVGHYHQELEKAKKEVVSNQKNILHLYNNINHQLLQTKSTKICAYCLTAFSMTEVNQPCAHNKSFKSQPTYKDLIIPAEIKGSKSHYWVNARKTQRPIPDLKTHVLVRNLHKKQFLNSLLDLKQVKNNLIRFDIEKGKKLAYINQFKPNDPDGTGNVTPLAFLFVMTNKFEVNQVQVQVLSELCSVKESALVNYTKIEEILQDPIKLYLAFEKEEQEFQKSKPIAPPSFRFRY